MLRNHSWDTHLLLSLLLLFSFGLTVGLWRKALKNPDTEKVRKRVLEWVGYGCTTCDSTQEVKWCEEFPEGEENTRCRPGRTLKRAHLCFEAVTRGIDYPNLKDYYLWNLLLLLTPIPQIEVSGVFNVEGDNVWKAKRNTADYHRNNSTSRHSDHANAT